VETNEQNYDLSFFKPTNPRTRSNRNMVLVLLIVWIVAVFGFHFLLRAIEEPVPEESLTKYQNVIESVKKGAASVQEKQTMVWSVLSVLGKTIKPDERATLGKIMSYNAYQLIPENKKAEIASTIESIANSKENLSTLSNEEFAKKRAEIKQNEINFGKSISSNLGLENNDIRTQLLSTQMLSDYNLTVTQDDYATADKIMNKYTIHNRSVLTDTQFLGFPFHYFYTAVFLLILFVVLCWVYAYQTKKLNKKYNFEG